MRKTNRPLRLVAFGLLAAITLPASSSHAADLEGKAGKIVRLTINAVGSHKYASFHGAITLKRSGANVVYKWGGSTCPAQTFTDAQVDLIAGAFHNRHKTLFAPKYAQGEGSGGTRCLVAFELVSGGGS